MITFNNRNAVEGKFKQSLLKDSLYKVSFYVSLSEAKKWLPIAAVSGIGAYLSVDSFNSIRTGSIRLTHLKPQVFAPLDSYLDDTAG